jgi:hypothetical protein
MKAVHTKWSRLDIATFSAEFFGLAELQAKIINTIVTKHAKEIA